MSKRLNVNIRNMLKKHAAPRDFKTRFDTLPAQLSEIFSEFRSSDQGLKEEDAEDLLKSYGRNEVVQIRNLSWIYLLLGNFKNPFILLLIVIGFVSYFSGDIKATTTVSIMVVVSVVMRFIQEFRSSKSAEALKSMVRVTTTVVRQCELEDEDGTPYFQGVTLEIPFEEIVPGDIVRLSVGDMIPADLVLLQSKDFFVSQSVLTGESLPVEKTQFVSTEPDPSKRKKKNRLALFETPYFCFMGTNVVSGTAIGLVIETGSRTCLGKMTSSILDHRQEPTSFDKGLHKVSWVLIRLMMVMVPVIFMINGLIKGNWQEAFLFGIAVAVGLTPEMLPMIVTANLAKGAVAMSRIKVIVKRLNAIQNLGAMDVLCTDKTGTLTQDKIILKEHLDFEGEISEQALTFAYLNSYYQTGLKNLLDRAILEHIELEASLRLPKKYAKVDEIPFDFVRRRMSVVVRTKKYHQLLICKGALEEMISICETVSRGEEILPITPLLRQQILEKGQELNRNGLRVVAVAYRDIPGEREVYSTEDETQLNLVGFIAFLDPPKETASSAIAALMSHGVKVKILTGDNDIVTRRVCKEVGLPVENIALGQEIDDLSDDKLYELSERTTVFAKLSPMQKARIIKALQHKGHTVGFLGDGINDAPALKDADVGISVDTASDIAKESADIILLEKSLLVLEDGIIIGRQVYGNIMKYIKMTSSANLGNVLSIVVASVFLPFLPMLPIHILVQNLLYDFSQLSIPWDKMDEDYLRIPRQWDTRGLTRFMMVVGPISSLFDLVTFGVMWYFFKANSVGHQTLFQTGWFVEGLLSQTLIIHMIRTEKIPFIESIASPMVLQLTALIMAIGIYLPFSPFQHYLHLESLPLAYFAWLFLILISYCFLTQGLKRLYIQKFKEWL